MQILICLIFVSFFVLNIMLYLKKKKNTEVFVSALDRKEITSQQKWKVIKKTTGYYKERKFTLMDTTKTLFIFMETKLTSKHKDFPVFYVPFMSGEWKKLDKDLSYYGGKVYYMPWCGSGLKFFFHRFTKDSFHKIFDEMISVAVEIESASSA